MVEFARVNVYTCTCGTCIHATLNKAKARTGTSNQKDNQ